MQKNTNQSNESYIVSSLSPKKSITTNPIDKGGFVAKINELGNGMNTGRISNVTVPVSSYNKKQ